MNRKNLVPVLLLLPLLFIPQRVLALEFCTADNQVNNKKECEAKVNQELLAEGTLATELSGEEAKTALQTLQEKKENTAASRLLTKVFPEIAAVPGASAALEDFLNRVKIGLTSEGTDNMQALAFDFTGFLGLPTNDGYKLQAVARDPVLYEALSAELSEEDRDKRTKGLGAFDDILVSFSYSPSTPHWGNNLGANQLLIDELFKRVLAQPSNTAQEDEATKAIVHLEDLTDEITEELRLPDEAFDEDGDLRAFDLITDQARQQEYREAVENVAIANAKSLSAMSESLKEVDFFKFADLVANQPQLVFKATTTVRDELTGPQESTVKLSYEHGFVNVNSLRRACKPPQDLVACFNSYMTKNQARLANAQNRLTFSLDWTQQKDYDPRVDGVSLDVFGKERWTITGAFGRNLRVDQDGNFTSRFDLSGSWEDWSDDPLHQDRGLANLSFTQKVTADMSLVLGAVWASKPEFRGEVDKEVSARFGLTYRFLDRNGKEIMRENPQ